LSACNILLNFYHYVKMFLIFSSYCKYCFHIELNQILGCVEKCFLTYSFLQIQDSLGSVIFLIGFYLLSKLRIIAVVLWKCAFFATRKYRSISSLDCFIWLFYMTVLCDMPALWKCKHLTFISILIASNDSFIYYRYFSFEELCIFWAAPYVYIYSVYTYIYLYICTFIYTWTSIPVAIIQYKSLRNVWIICVCIYMSWCDKK
jgi:hypothetical protein